MQPFFFNYFKTLSGFRGTKAEPYPPSLEDKSDDHNTTYCIRKLNYRLTLNFYPRRRRFKASLNGNFKRCSSRIFSAMQIKHCSAFLRACTRPKLWHSFVMSVLFFFQSFSIFFLVFFDLQYLYILT